jgi:hypothetical protein
VVNEYDFTDDGIGEDDDDDDEVVQ